MATKTLTTTASCKHCGGTVILEVQNVPADQTAQQSRSGGVSSKPCAKCHKTSSYSYQIRGGQFSALR